MKLPIYLDYQSTTPIDPRVIDVMTQSMENDYGNPHSRTHSYGWVAEEKVEIARKQIADLINADAKEIFFTSGATESNNIAIKGVANFYKKTGKNHIITVTTEHKCVINSARELEQEGFEVTFLNVDETGIINLESLEKAITKNTCLVSIMTLNNEIGAIQPIAEIGKICRKHNIFFHSDSAQAFGKIPLNVNDMNIDLMSISGHKIYGPKGLAQYILEENPELE